MEDIEEFRDTVIHWKMNAEEIESKMEDVKVIEVCIYYCKNNTVAMDLLSIFQSMVSDLDFKDVSELQKTVQDWNVNVRKLELKARHLDALEVNITVMMIHEAWID